MRAPDSLRTEDRSGFGLSSFQSHLREIAIPLAFVVLAPGPARGSNVSGDAAAAGQVVERAVTLTLPHGAEVESSLALADAGAAFPQPGESSAVLAQRIIAGKIPVSAVKGVLFVSLKKNVGTIELSELEHDGNGYLRLYFTPSIEKVEAKTTILPAEVERVEAGLLIRMESDGRQIEASIPDGAELSVRAWPNSDNSRIEKAELRIRSNDPELGDLQQTLTFVSNHRPTPESPRLVTVRLAGDSVSQAGPQRVKSKVDDEVVLPEYSRGLPAAGLRTANSR